MNSYTAVRADQATVIRQFIAGCEETHLGIPNLKELLLLLGYKQLADGLRVSEGTQVKVPFGQNVKDHYKDEYHADWEAYLKAEIESNASASESPEGDEVGDLLREEV